MTQADKSVIPARVLIVAAALIFYAGGRAAGEVIGWRKGAEYGRGIGLIQGWHAALRPLVANSERKVSDAAFNLVCMGPPEAGS